MRRWGRPAIAAAFVMTVGGAPALAVHTAAQSGPALRPSTSFEKCAADAPLPVSVATSIVDHVATVEGAVVANAGPLPVGLTQTLKSQLGCAPPTTFHFP